MVAWVFFRAADFHSALRMLRGLAGTAGIGGGPFALLFAHYTVPPDSYARLGRCWRSGSGSPGSPPNTQQIGGAIRFRSDGPACMAIGALLFAILLLAAIGASRGAPSFIYFNF